MDVPAGQSVRKRLEIKRLSWLSIVLPCHNEAGVVRGVVADALAVGGQIATRLEVLVVDDGSTDASPRILAEMAAEHQELRVVTHEMNQGYGAALRTGFTEARGDYVFYTDGDGQFQLDDLHSAVPLLEDHDIAVGYRDGRRDPWFRKLAGSVWTGLMNRCFGLRVRDVNCAFKVFPRALFQEIEIESEGALVDAEVLAKARQLGLRIGEFPVVHLPRELGEPSGVAPHVVFRALLELSRMLRQRAGW